jgi:hypothetical protein
LRHGVFCDAHRRFAVENARFRPGENIARTHG